MITVSVPLEVITPCFSAGAEPGRQAEIRGASVRGQLRWWFRTLGGFEALKQWPVADQEQILFGVQDRRDGRMGKLGVRVILNPADQRRQTLTDAENLGARDAFAPLSYILPELHAPKQRAAFLDPLPKFTLQLSWRGTLHPWASADELTQNLRDLAAVFGHLGSLGYRSRRAMGALAFQTDPPDLAKALQRFLAARELVIKQLPARDGKDAVIALAHWLRKWRSYGRSSGNRLNPFKPGFHFAKNDHDAGRQRQINLTYRPALGLPILQKYSTDSTTVRWDYLLDVSASRRGRFASPILLRPFRKAPGRWQALVVFVDNHRWPLNQPVHLNGQPKTVSLDLYEAMKQDPELKPL